MRMRHLVVTTCVFGGSVLFGGTPPAVEETVALHPTVHADYTVPKWQNHRLTVVRALGSGLAVYSKDGSLLLESGAEVPQAPTAVVADAAVSLEGRMAVAGSGYAPDSAQQSTYLMMREPNGEIDWLISTEPFASARVCFADDGTLWTAGREHTADFGTVPEGAVMRHYSAEGVLLHSALPAKTFNVKGMSPAVNAVLACGRDRAGLYSVYGDEWVEIDQSGALLGRWPGIPNLDNRETAVLGGAFTATGDVYISRQETSSDQGSSELRLYRLDKTVGQWEQFDTPSESSFVVGSDGERLVIYSNASGQRSLGWVRVADGSATLVQRAAASSTKVR